ncbi:MAG: outer membrane beta-barrel protein [Candidatus Polarisedimenticolaceae bacterium]|nr:outer membrane beta-barrel protein [Candidatus Polarisedimenticolaceae bacterium]
MQTAKFIPVLILFLMISPSHAEQGKAIALYDEAVQAMRGKAYQEAVRLFDQAQQAGMASGKLNYNKGVALYKLHRYKEAKKALLTAEAKAGNPTLVRYNLGLVSYRLSEVEEAEYWFNEVSREMKGEKLGSFADEMLAKLNDKKPSKQAGKLWSVIIDSALGYDDNVTLENTEIAQGTNKSDFYLDLYGSVAYRFSDDKRNGLSVRLGLATIKYQNESRYNSTLYNAGLYQDNQFSDWRTRVGLKITRINLGGKEYLQKNTLQLQAAHYLSKSLRLRGRYDLSTYHELDDNYAHLAGQRHKIKLDGMWKGGNTKLRVGYDLELNDRDDLQWGSNFTSYSATRHNIKATLSFPLIDKLRGKLGAEYRQSIYNDANIVSGVSGDTREDDRYRYRLEATYKLNRKVDLVGKYRYTDNVSNITSSSYRHSQILLGLQSYF